jgi:hypothetical protein
MRSVQRIFLAIFVSLLLLSACSNSKTLPQGWRLPTSQELKDTWRNESENKCTVVKGDFNGDGIIDEAKLLVREDSSGFGVFAFIYQKNYSSKIYQLDEMKDVKLIQAMGIKKVSPGTYKTACGKGYWDCQKDEVPEINIKNEAIDYFKTEAANSFFYWDNKSNSFKRIWISD